MKDRCYSRIPLVLVVTVLMIAIMACDDDQREAIDTIFEQHYLIDPSSLISSIAQGHTNLFEAIDIGPELPPPSQQVPVDWSQTDYLRIVEALYQDVWEETLAGWSLKSVSFTLGCTKIDNGFQNASFQYFRNVNSNGSQTRIERFIHIDPRSKSISILESEYSPRLTDWGSIDLMQVLVSADAALQIAEDNGGQKKRMLVENACDISLLLSPDSAGYRGWEVWYSSKGAGQIFQIQVDPFTGEVHFP